MAERNSMRKIDFLLCSLIIFSALNVNCSRQTASNSTGWKSLKWAQLGLAAVTTILGLKTLHAHAQMSKAKKHDEIFSDVETGLYSDLGVVNYRNHKINNWDDGKANNTDFENALKFVGASIDDQKKFAQQIYNYHGNFGSERSDYNRPQIFMLMDKYLGKDRLCKAHSGKYYNIPMTVYVINTCQKKQSRSRLIYGLSALGTGLASVACYLWKKETV